MNVVVVEDETLAAERLVRLVQSYDQSINILHQFDTVAETARFFESKPKVDLLFLDIQLADGKSFSIFEKVQIDTPIIFTTAYDQFAIQAFKLNSIDYLLKPIQESDLIAALEKFKRLSPTSKTLSEDDIKMFKSLLNQSSLGYKERFVVKAGNKLQYKPVNSIAYFYAEGKMAYPCYQR
jgi:DNA-binding LytR/AlgR family response regulator